MLTPWQTQVKEEFRQTFVIYSSFWLFLELVDSFLSDAFVSLPNLLGLSVRVKFRLLIRLGLLLNRLDLFGTGATPLGSFSLQIDFPILFSALPCRLGIKIQNQRLLYSHIQINILLFSQSIVISLLKQHKPLWQRCLKLKKRLLLLISTYQLMIVQHYLFLQF